MRIKFNKAAAREILAAMEAAKARGEGATVYKVPCLGDLPLVSWLFKSTADTESRTNLYIFMTPRVVNTQDQAQDVYKEKIDYMQGLSSEKIKMYDSGKAHTETETQP